MHWYFYNIYAIVVVIVLSWINIPISIFLAKSGQGLAFRKYVENMKSTYSCTKLHRRSTDGGQT